METKNSENILTAIENLRTDLGKIRKKISEIENSAGGIYLRNRIIDEVQKLIFFLLCANSLKYFWPEIKKFSGVILSLF